MTTPTVAVTRVEAQGGWLVTCADCPNYRRILPETEARQRATLHRAAHGDADTRGLA